MCLAQARASNTFTTGLKLNKGIDTMIRAGNAMSILNPVWGCRTSEAARTPETA